MVCQIVFQHCRPLGVYAAETDKEALGLARKEHLGNRLWGMVAVPLEDRIVTKIVDLHGMHS